MSMKSWVEDATAHSSWVSTMPLDTSVPATHLVQGPW